MLYAVEASQPEISRTKLEGLREHYAFVQEGPATEYFAVHELRDVEHAEAAARLIGELMASEPDPEAKAAGDGRPRRGGPQRQLGAALGRGNGRPAVRRLLTRPSPRSAATRRARRRPRSRGSGSRRPRASGSAAARRPARRAPSLSPSRSVPKARIARGSSAAASSSSPSGSRPTSGRRVGGPAAGAAVGRPRAGWAGPPRPEILQARDREREVQARRSAQGVGVPGIVGPGREHAARVGCGRDAHAAHRRCRDRAGPRAARSGATGPPPAGPPRRRAGGGRSPPPLFSAVAARAAANRSSSTSRDSCARRARTSGASRSASASSCSRVRRHEQLDLGAEAQRVLDRVEAFEDGELLGSRRARPKRGMSDPSRTRRSWQRPVARAGRPSRSDASLGFARVLRGRAVRGDSSHQRDHGGRAWQRRVLHRRARDADGQAHGQPGRTVRLPPLLRRRGRLARDGPDLLRVPGGGPRRGGRGDGAPASSGGSPRASRSRSGASI